MASNSDPANNTIPIKSFDFHQCFHILLPLSYLLFSMAKKPIKKTPPKKNPKIPGLPKDAKVIELNLSKIFVFPLVFIALVWASYIAWNQYAGENITYNDDKGLNEVIARYNSGSYEEVVVSGNKIEGRTPAKTRIISAKEVKTRDVDRVTLPDNMVITDIKLPDPTNPTKVTISNNDVSKAFWDIVPSVLGFLLLLMVAFFFMNRMGGGMGGPMAFIKSRARMYDPEMDEKVTFDDVAGSDEEKSDLVEIVDFLKNPAKYKDLGAKIPRGILLQ